MLEHTNTAHITAASLTYWLTAWSRVLLKNLTGFS